MSSYIPLAVLLVAHLALALMWRRAARIANGPRPAWEVRLGLGRPIDGVYYRGKRVKHLRSVDVIGRHDDAPVIWLEIVALDGVGVYAEDGTLLDLKTTVPERERMQV